MTYDDFNPFYEKLSKTYFSGFIGKLLFSIFLSILVLGLHYISIGSKVFVNYGWVLSVIIIVACLSLFYATHTFRMLIPKFGSRLSSGSKKRFISHIHRYLNNKTFIAYAATFGVLNLCMGILFKLPEVYATPLDKITIVSSYFLAGFVCGLALAGIMGVTKCISNVFEYDGYFLDYTAHDNCGGTQFIGWSLLIFSLVTLSVGILITFYMSSTEWYGTHTVFVNILYFSWVTLPYIASLIILIVPAISINNRLTKYKLEQDKKLSKIIKELFSELEGVDVSSDRRKELYADYEFQTNMRRTLHEMRTWPFSVGTNSTYFISLLVSAFGTVSNVRSWLPEVS